MSRSNNVQIKNPAKVFFEWAGGKGCLKYYDKEANAGKGETVEVGLPFPFLVLDRLSCIAGFSDADQSGFWSNEIRDTRTEKLIVRTKKGVIAEGLYNSPAIDKAKTAGAQYAQSVYIAFYDNEKVLHIGNLKLTGSGIGPWIEFLKKNDVYTKAVSITGSIAKKKGTTNFYEPVFSLKDVTEETNAKAIELDKELQEYFKLYFKRSETDIAPADVVTEKQRDDISNLSAEGHGRGGNQGGAETDDEPLDNFTDNNFPGGSPADDLPF